ncbi:chromate efflux transporter [Thermostichus vulcanus]|uniref:Chromate efflux transporter n=1 Tax=Thermostichus vulcanus str. 'Rupite' TaxID=2813851 RepID=A0ABT0CES5_THEVL|nr:chromate efflux transporter [Thermostichus vulcanus]MCJ2544284.1 chromate efflux transporter [Thermostichus vulcanus str. 'Rupite']
MSADPSPSQSLALEQELPAPLPPLSVRLKEIAAVFLRLGFLGFGGPQAHIAMQNDEAVTRRGWMSQEQFTEGVGLCELLPGPASTQMGIYIGYVRAGWAGAVLAGFCFIAPAFVIEVMFSWLYFRFQKVPQLQGVFFGVAPVVIAIILAFCWKLGRKAVKDWSRGLIAVAAFVLLLLAGVNILLLFALAAAVGLVLYGPRRPWPGIPGLLPWPLLSLAQTVVATVPPETLTLSSFWGLERIGTYFWPMTLFFLKVGSAIFGGGLVIIPFIAEEVVEQLRWLTPAEFLDGVAIGQFTPGPVVLTAAFIGYKVAGVLGALTATVAIFAPSFAFILLAAPVLLRIRRNAWAKGSLQAMTPTALGAIAAATIPLAQNALLQDTPLASLLALLIGGAALVGLMHFKLPTWLLVLAGGGVGWLVGGLVT